MYASRASNMADATETPAPQRVWTFNNIKFSTAAACLKAAVAAKNSGKAAYWQLLKIEELDGEVRVSCKRTLHTGARFGVTNIPRFAKDHYGGNFQTCVRIAGKGKRPSSDAPGTEESAASLTSQCDCVAVV